MYAHIHFCRWIARFSSLLPLSTMTELYFCIASQTSSIPSPVRDDIILTFGLQKGLFLLMYFSADVYSDLILLAAGTKSPSHLLTTTRSLCSTIPLLMPWSPIQ